MTSLQQDLNPTLTERPQTETEQFQWTKQWYPVAAVEFIDPTRPHPVQLLGKDLVLWRDGSGQWRCFADACPHRLVPLSEGRVESDGTLLCAYHAWRFDGTGNCVSIPQSEDSETEAKHCSNPKSCAVVYPTQERQGLLWVWGESGSEAQQESLLKSPRLVPELEEDSDQVVKLPWGFRDIPYGWDFFMENISDPAHVPVSHHGIIGNRYKDAKYYDMISLRNISTQEGFAFKIIPTQPQVLEAVHDFQPPCHQKIYVTNIEGGKMILALYATPTRPGWCRTFGRQILVKDKQGKTPGGLGFLALPMPIWLNHVLAPLFMHQDLVFLHYQEKILAKRKNKRWLEEVYTPNPQDKMVITFRQWIEKRAGGGIPWSEECNPHLPLPELNKQQLFDVWSTHTQHCKVCQNALKNINRLTVFSYIAAIVFLGLAVMVDARTVEQLTAFPPMGFWVLLGCAIAFATAGYYLKKFSRLFYIYEFEHAHND